MAATHTSRPTHPDAKPGQQQAAFPLETGTRLAFERTFLAHERTQMAWVRTALALISFGFTIAKFFEYLREQRGGHAPVVGSRTVGVLMIAAGLVAMAVADVHHRRAMKDLRKQCPELPVSIAGITSAFIVLLGILALVGVVLRQ